MDRLQVISSLNNYQGSTNLVMKSQTVSDIIREIIRSHKMFAADYDRIAKYFDADSTAEICTKIDRFLRANINYRMEPEARQTTKSPAAILATNTGDCKHLASMAGGILDGLNRLGKNIDWRYCFASYSFFNPDPEHIFVIVQDKGREIWIDPTPGADRVKPVWTVNKKVKAITTMALYRISGPATPAVYSFPVNDLLDSIDYQQNPSLYQAIQLLLKYGVMNGAGKVNNSYLNSLQNKVPASVYDDLLQATAIINQNIIGGFFDTIWRGVKKVTLAAPRGAFLSLVAINAFGYATKLKNGLNNDDGSYTALKDKLKTLWQDRLGGDWTKLQNTINQGATHKAILGVAPAAALPAWLAVASAVIAAVMPLLNAFLKTKQQSTGINYDVDPVTGLPYGSAGTLPATTGGSDPLTFLKNNPVLVLGGIAAVLYLTKKKRQ